MWAAVAGAKWCEAPCAAGGAFAQVDAEATMNEGKEDAKREARDTAFEQQPAGDSRSEMGAESAAGGSPAKRHRLRRILTPILVVLTVVVFTVTVPAA